MTDTKKIKALFCGGYILEDGTVVTDDGNILPPDEDNGTEVQPEKNGMKTVESEVQEDDERE